MAKGMQEHSFLLELVGTLSYRQEVMARQLEYVVSELRGYAEMCNHANRNGVQYYSIEANIDRLRDKRQRIAARLKGVTDLEHLPHLSKYFQYLGIRL